MIRASACPTQPFTSSISIAAPTVSQGWRRSSIGLSLAWTRILAIDGRELGPPPWPDHDLRGFDRCLGKSPNPNEVGCYLSHVAALKAAAASEDAISLILEDDAKLSADFREVIEDADSA